jgi:hypothetical protein
MGRWLLTTLALALLPVACLQQPGESGEAPTGELAVGLDGCPLPVATARRTLAIDDADVDVCAALAQREARCFDGCAATVEVEACAERMACSRRLWRGDIADEVYACIRERPCDDLDPATACLHQAAAEVAPSEARLRFEDEQRRVDALCGDMLDVAPGQSDDVYQRLGSCLAEETSCEGVAACAMGELADLVDLACGPPVLHD